MVADVPVCAYLSGGIDSTLVCLEMARLGGKRLKAFNVGFSHSVFDESAQAGRSPPTQGSSSSRCRAISSMRRS